MTKPVTLAAIAGAHGVAGEVRLKLFGEGVAGLSCHKSFNEGALTLLKIRDDGKGGAVARLSPASCADFDTRLRVRRVRRLEPRQRRGRPF
jgi:16S rRNA processing protein RimM